MDSSKFTRMVLLLGALTIGVWLLGRASGPQPEGVARMQALNRLSEIGTAGDQAQGRPATGQSLTLDPVESHVVDFAAVEISTDNPDSQYNRWLRGEIDMEEESGPLSEAEMAQLLEEARQQPPDEDVQIAREGPSPAAPFPGPSFDAIDFTKSGGAVPPDPEIAAGPDHLIAVVNVSVAIYDKSGTALLGPTAASNLFSQDACVDDPTVEGDYLYDPNVLYDEDADRFIIAYDQGPFQTSGGFCLLASQTGDPLGAWNEYFFPINDSSVWMDFPHSGVGDNYVVTGANMFDYSENFVEGRLFAFDKSKLYSGAAVSAVQYSLGSGGFTPQPLNLHGAGAGTWPAHGDEHYVLTDPYDGRHYAIRRWNPVSNTLTTVGTADLGSAGQAISVPQNGGGDLQANDWRPLDFEYRNGYGWTTMTVSCNPGGGSVDCIRWAQIDLSDASLGPAGSGVYASDGDYRFFPDLAVNRCGDMAVGYTKSSTSINPAIWLTGRQSGDAAGALQAESQLKAGEIAYTDGFGSPYRWGDYTGMTIDPDGETFWYLGQYSKDTGTSSGRWGTYVGSFTFPECTSSGSFYYEYLPTLHKPSESPPPTHLENGDFEDGPGVGWQQSSSHNFQLIEDKDTLNEDVGLDPRSGNYAAWLGGAPNEISNLSQEVDVPSADANLRFWYWIGSADVCGYDFGRVVIGAADVVDVFNLCQSTNTGGWVQRTVDLSSYAGQSVTLSLRAETDESLNSNLFLDDVTLGSPQVSLESTTGATDPALLKSKSEAGVPKLSAPAPPPGPALWAPAGERK